ncbi:MAG: trypsin-like peptidase domain-containing protein [Planctomycetes bacterium]|nr:trypsin-like peptidase domain-containing protein [Planctomycetota bacterium]
MVDRNSLRVSLLGGASCLVVGLGLGLAWPRAAREQPWQDPPPAPALASGRSESEGLPSFAPVVRAIGPGVVTVQALRLAKTTQPRPRERSGSGFVVQAKGLVLTSRHVVVDADDVEVIVPGHGPFVAEIVGEDRATDLALLRLVDAPDDLVALPLADGNDLQAGDWIVTVGNPLGLAQTVTAGIVSFVGRHLMHSDCAFTNDFLQISAPVNPGNSGCPVVDQRGRVVGVTTQAPVEAQGISFAVPGHSVKWALSQMQSCADGRVRRGFLGIQFASVRGVDDSGNGLDGAVVTQVLDGQPAQRAGLLSGDIVLGVNGVPVRDAQSLHECIVRTPPGTQVALQVLRQGSLADPIVAVLGEADVRPPG